MTTKNEELAQSLLEDWCIKHEDMAKLKPNELVAIDDISLRALITTALNQKDSGHQAEMKKLEYDERYCPCGGIILADTDDCKVPVCIECAIEISKAYLPMDQNYNEGFASGVQSKVEEITTLKADLKLAIECLDFYAKQWQPHITHGNQSSWKTGFDEPTSDLKDDGGDLARSALSQINNASKKVEGV